MTPAHRLRCDGAARGNPGPAGIGVILEDAGGMVVEEIARGIGWATNNVAEYRALLEGLEAARRRGLESLEVYADSSLLVEQMRGKFKVKSPALKPLHAQAAELARSFERIRFFHVPRERNAGADRLANRGIEEWLAANPGFSPPEEAERRLF